MSAALREMLAKGEIQVRLSAGPEGGLSAEVRGEGTDDERAAVAKRLESLSLEDADWSGVAGPLGTLLLAGGVLGGITAIVSGYLTLNRPELATPLIKFSLWATTCVVVGVLGLIQFRRTELPDKLISTQTLGVWVFIAIAGALTQVVGRMLHLGPYALIPVTSLLIGVGIATLAFQTRRWLLAPALACFAASLFLGAYPQFSRYILGCMLLVGVGGLGLALRLGAPLDPLEA